MKKINLALVLILVCSLLFSVTSFAHSGRTDSSGGHNCSAKSKSKGLCTGYHYHNGGSSSSSSSSSSGSSSSYSAPAIKKTKIIYNEYPLYSYCKKVKDVYRSSDTYLIYYERIWDCNRYTDNGTVYTELDLTIQLDGLYSSLQKSLVSIQDSTYISLKDFAKLFGFGITIDSEKDVTVKKDNKSLKIFNETRKIFLNGKFSGFKAVTIEGSWYVPLRYVVRVVGGTIASVDSYSINILNKKIKIVG